MAGEMKIEKSELVDTGLQSETSAKLDDENVASGRDGLPPDSTSSMSSSGVEASSIKGYSGTFNQLDGGSYYHADGSSTGVQSDNGSFVYYMPGCDPYAVGNHIGVDGKFVGQQPFCSTSGYLQHPVSYGSEAVPYYAWDTSVGGGVSNEAPANLGNARSGPGRYTSAKLNSMSSTKANGNVAPKLSKLPLGPKSHQSAASASSKFLKPFFHTGSLRPLNTVSHLGSDFSGGLGTGYHPVVKFSSITNHKQGPLPHNAARNYRANEKTWNGNYGFKLRENSNGKGEFGASKELTCGPRATSQSSIINSSDEKEDLGFVVRRDQYNLHDFQTEYKSVKFYVIKSFNEDNIHRCVKYGVWSSTVNGNKKLDTAFHGAETKARETGESCPIFLFFSVNGSGQFVGLAEMIGPVDFNKDMNFWQLDKWSGFFPVKWHIIKDIPNSQLRHIILEDNDNRPVTYTRDTQEIPYKQGLETLNIFKSYPAKRSILDDFKFYENREKSFLCRKSNKPASTEIEIYESDDFAKQFRVAGERKIEDDSAQKNRTPNPTSSLISLAKSLSLNTHPIKSNDMISPREMRVHLVPSTEAM